jgi:CHAT domain-containing protein
VSLPLTGGAADLQRSAVALGLGAFQRLPATRREAEAILALAPAGQGLAALGFDASRRTVMNGSLERYRIIHFATHGILHPCHPELSGIVLSLVDQHGRPQEGFLRAHEIASLDLPADLVVLSACQTAMGRQLPGEGVESLARSFMDAGAARTVVSYWSVSDQATAELMQRFYRGVLEQGLLPAAALRAAQVAMIGETEWQAPYYWAAFVFQGEWR